MRSPHNSHRWEVHTFCSHSQVGHKYICEYHNSVVYQMKAKRRRKESDDDSEPSSSDVRQTFSLT